MRRHATPAWTLAAMTALTTLTALPTVSLGATERAAVTRADQLPRRNYPLPQLPSELLQAPLAVLLPLAEQLDRDTAADLAAYDIRDAAAQRALLQTRLSVALLRGDLAAVRQWGAAVRALQDKPGLRLTSAVLLELALQARQSGGDAPAQNARLQALAAERFGAMPWDDVQAVLKQTKGQLEMASSNLVLGSVRAGMDPGARNAGMVLDGTGLAAVLGARAQLEALLPLRDGAVAALGALIDRQAAAAPERPDRWTPRTVALPADAPAQPVRVAVWDSGVDLSLFRTVPGALKGIAFGPQGEPAQELLRPLGEAQARWPQLRNHVKGALDLRAALDTPEARGVKAAVAALGADQVKGFQEDLTLVSLYAHGTHVAGIAVEGNPFAQLFAVTMLWSHRFEPVRPSETLARRTAANYRSIVRTLQDNGIRVVNMSWRYGPQAYEGALAWHGVGREAEERKRLALALFAIERDALREAIASAPDILFVAGAGNEDNSADFVEYIPAGLDLPNLITAGAVDRAGEETAFSTFGRTVVVHANGFEVDSVIPGGERLRQSGTSMAAPQVTNLAAKLLALEPGLTPVQLKALMLAHAERRGRVNLLNPRASVQALQAQQAQRARQAQEAAVPRPAG